MSVWYTVWHSSIANGGATADNLRPLSSATPPGSQAACGPEMPSDPSGEGTGVNHRERTVASDSAFAD